MWQLDILSRVLPLFYALATDFIDHDELDARLRKDIQECYADIVLIGFAVSMSGGEWAFGLDIADINKLLSAFETRFPTRRNPLSIFSVQQPSQPKLDGYGDRTQFPHLSLLESRINIAGLGGYDECGGVLCQSEKKRRQYLDLIPDEVCLFHKKERFDLERRAKFLKRIKRAAKHLSEVYCDQNQPDSESFSLSQHPSQGMKEFADRVYDTIERHSRCKCPQRAARPFAGREARLSLIRHRQLGPRTKDRAIHVPSLSSAKFEILLPACKNSVEWKVTNVEIQKSKSMTELPKDGELVQENLCEYLRESDESCVVDFLIEKNHLWHLKPRFLDQINYYSTMETLQQFLGDGLELSLISKFNPQNQLILCYVLANSMLYFYPSSWLQMEWNSSMVYFTRRSRNSTTPMLTCPYVSVELLKCRKPKQAAPHMQYHTHPAILALGIMFLEIASGVRFHRSQEETAWKQCNADNREAWRLFQCLEKSDRYKGTKKISRGMSKAIRACLKLEPPATFPSNQLSEEGPIRHYILSCIVGPLAEELQRGYHVSLDDLHKALMPMMDGEIAGLTSDSRRSTASFEHHFETHSPSKTTIPNRTKKTQAPGKIDHTPVFSDTRVPCSYRDGEAMVDENKVREAEKWFNWHDNALARVLQSRNSQASDSRTVKIAILDSGIELSEDNQDKYNFEPRIQYKDWVDEKPEWQDQVGHGTHLAILMRKIAPRASIHVGRVFKKRPTKKSASLIADAIRHAVDHWKVDIIVMSFGFGDEVSEIEDAIRHAAFKSVLMFAAASNDGKNRPDGIAWPAKDGRVICVHSADGFGKSSNFTPSPQDSMRIMVLGEGIKSAWPPRPDYPEDHKLMSGTSCAAPIAAGIAALVLDYARDFLTDEEWKRLRRKDSILRMFDRLKDPNSTDGYWWIMHWRWFVPKNSDGWIQGEIRAALS